MGGRGEVVSCFHVGDSFIEVRGGLGLYTCISTVNKRKIVQIVIKAPNLV